MRNIDIFLREKGIKPSYQRKRIYEFLHQNPIHPTVNDIYWALIHDIPTCRELLDRMAREASEHLARAGRLIPS